MAIRAYILIEATVGASRGVVQALRTKQVVREAYLITGPYDLIAIVDGEGPNDIHKVVSEVVHSVPGVARTVTCLSVATGG